MNYSNKVYYKVRWQLLQSATAFFITNCDNLLLQSATAILLQSVTSVITKCDRYYKVRRFYYKVRQVLQSVTIITKCDRTEVKPLLSRRSINAEKPVKRKLFSTGSHNESQSDMVPEKTYPILSKKTTGLLIPRTLIRIENLWSIIEEEIKHTETRSQKQWRS